MNDIDQRIPLCDICSANQVAKRLLGGKKVCQECYDEWVMGRFDQDPPEGHEEGE